MLIIEFCFERKWTGDLYLDRSSLDVVGMGDDANWPLFCGSPVLCTKVLRRYFWDLPRDIEGKVWFEFHNRPATDRYELVVKPSGEELAVRTQVKFDGRRSMAVPLWARQVLVRMCEKYERTKFYVGCMYEEKT